jgi:hypothetical protein
MEAKITYSYCRSANSSNSAVKYGANFFVAE